MSAYAIPEALPRIQAAVDAGILTAGNWGNGTEAVCMMSAAVTGAQSTDDCVTAKWPKWLADLNVSLFDAEIGVDDESKARAQFALDVAKAVFVPRNFEKARDLFLIATLDRINVYDAKNVSQPVIDLLHRRIAGENVDHEMKDASAAAGAAADAATYDASAAADAYAAYAASAAAYAFVDAAVDAAAYAAYAAMHIAADASVDAAADAARAANAAAYAPARADLITVLKKS